MPVVNRKQIKDLLSNAALFFGVSSTDHQMGVPPEIDDSGNLKVIDSNTTTISLVLATINASLLSILTHFIGTCLEVVRGRGNIVTAVITADTNVKAAPGDVYWLTLSCDDTLTVRINDSTNDTGIDFWDHDFPADAYAHFIYDPPLQCGTGIWIDIVAAGTAKVTVGYK